MQIIWIKGLYLRDRFPGALFPGALVYMWADCEYSGVIKHWIIVIPLRSDLNRVQSNGFAACGDLGLATGEELDWQLDGHEQSANETSVCAHNTPATMLRIPMCPATFDILVVSLLGSLWHYRYNDGGGHVPRSLLRLSCVEKPFFCEFFWKWGSSEFIRECYDILWFFQFTFLPLTILNAFFNAFFTAVEKNYFLY